MEDFVTWVDTSKIKRTVMNYNDEVGGNAIFTILANKTLSLMTLISFDCIDTVVFLIYSLIL